MSDQVVGSMLLITDVRDDTVNVITTAGLTQSTPVNETAAAAFTTTTVCFYVIAVYVPQTCVHTCKHSNNDSNNYYIIIFNINNYNVCLNSQEQHIM